MDEKYKKGELEIKKWEVVEKGLDATLTITLDKENTQKLLTGLIGLLKDNDTFYVGFNLNEFGVHFEHRKPKEEELLGKN